MRNSERVHKDRTYHGILKFSWDELEAELQILAPHLLPIVKKHCCRQTIMNVWQMQHSDAERRCLCNACNVQRNNNTSIFNRILLHGGCTQRVTLKCNV